MNKMTQDEQMLAGLDAIVKASIPGYARQVKEDSSVMRFLNFFARAFNKNFMAHYITTLYPRVYFPRALMQNSQLVWKVLAHEWVHLHHAKKQTAVVHGLLYVAPHWFAALSLVSLVAIWGGPWWLLNLCWLVFAAPLPAYFRAREELSAYTVSMAVNYWRYGSVLTGTKEHIAKQFYGSFYYFMWPFKKTVLRWLDEEEQKLMTGEYDNVTPYKEIKGLIKTVWPTVT